MKTRQQIEDETIDYKNRKFAKDADNLARAKKESKFWSSWQGTVAKLPEAMKDTILGAIKKRLKK
jgi:hypothetical protein